jgi:hypothetical protein
MALGGMGTTDIIAGVALVVASISAYFVFKQIQRADQLKAAEFVNTIEDKLIEHYRVYRFLLLTITESTENTEAQMADPLDMLAYVGFFERILPIVENRAVPMHYVDRVFGYRFFLMAHHPYVQKHILLNRTYADSFSSIFQLHSQWKRFRVRRGIPIPFTENDLDGADREYYRAELHAHRRARRGFH